MIQRIQTVYLMVAALAMIVCAFFSAATPAVAITAVVAAMTSGYAISLYKKRPLQANICRMLCLAGVALIIYIATTLADNLSQKEFLCPAAATLVAILCWFLASSAIMKDEKLVRSLDRIR